MANTDALSANINASAGSSDHLNDNSSFSRPAPGMPTFKSAHPPLMRYLSSYSSTFSEHLSILPAIFAGRHHSAAAVQASFRYLVLGLLLMAPADAQTDMFGQTQPGTAPGAIGTSAMAPLPAHQAGNPCQVDIAYTVSLGQSNSNSSSSSQQDYAAVPVFVGSFSITSYAQVSYTSYTCVQTPGGLDNA